jgi:hypothetical protein
MSYNIKVQNYNIKKLVKLILITLQWVLKFSDHMFICDYEMNGKTKIEP